VKLNCDGACKKNAKFASCGGLFMILMKDGLRGLTPRLEHVMPCMRRCGACISG